MQQHYILQEEVNSSKVELGSLVDSLLEFLIALNDKDSNCLQNRLSKPKVEIGSTKSKGNLFNLFYEDIMER